MTRLAAGATRLASVRAAVVAILVATVVATVSGDTFAGDSGARAAPAGCGAPATLMVLEPPQTRIAARIGRREPLTIVAIGSSSTQGIGATSPELSYPSRLEAELKERFPAIAIRVINRGNGGEDAPEELRRLDRDVLALRPDLVIWQVGTNAVLRRDDLATDRALIERGILQIKQSGSDVVLMDLQYAPRVIARPGYDEMEQALAQVAERTGVGLFRRFQIMQHWQKAAPQTATIGGDGLHMTDRGYFCLAASLAEALAWNWLAKDEVVAEEPPPETRVAGVVAVAAPAAGAAR